MNSVIRACPTFESDESSESVETLCAKLHEYNVKLATRRTLEKAATMFADHDGYEIQRFLEEALDKQRQAINARTGAGAANWTRNTADRLDEYERRERGEYGTTIPLFWSELDDAVGGFHAGDYVNVIAWTKRGKSWISLLAALTANRAGYKVLAELAESTKSEAGYRLDTLEFGLSNRGLFAGSLDEESKRTYVRKLSELNESGRPDFVIKTPEDWHLGLTLRQVEADIDQYAPDVVLIDQFSLMRYDGGTNWEAKEATSKALKLLFARKGVIGIVVTQANADYGKRQAKREDEDSDIHELNPPSESDFSGTIATIQDATHVIAFDSVQWLDPDGKERGKAQAVVRISRTGGAGTIIDLEWLPNDGIARPRRAEDIF